jgi:hypothetical protein
MAVILFNKWILAYSGFPFPLALTMCVREGLPGDVSSWRTELSTSRCCRRSALHSPPPRPVHEAAKLAPSSLPFSPIGKGLRSPH